MNWYYVEAGKQAGPVDDAQLDEFSRSGKIQPDTLVWREGMANWQAYREIKPTASDVPEGVAAGGAGVVCSECGKRFPPDQVISYGGRWVCGACKPIFLQRMREGVALPAAGPRGTASEADLLARDYVVDVGGCLSRAWELFKGNAGILIGCSVLVYLALVGVNLIPYLSVLLALIFQGPLLGGLWVFYVKKVRNEEAGVRDAFSGFGPRFWHMTLTQLMPALVVIPIVAILAALLVPALVAARHGHTGAGALTPALVVPLGIAFVVFFGLMVYLNTCWLFALPLVGDKGMKFWPALQLSRRVVAKHWWMTLWLLMVCGFLGMIGLVLCLVGLLVTGPVAFAALACHYEKVFGDLASIQE